jgi:hypothetical protein
MRTFVHEFVHWQLVMGGQSRDQCARLSRSVRPAQGVDISVAIAMRGQFVRQSLHKRFVS